MTRYFFPFMDKTQAVTVTSAARFFSQADCVRSIPLHLENVLLAVAFNDALKCLTSANCFQS
jgi:hypothetical protein